MGWPLGYRGRQVLAAIEKSVERRREVPSYREIADQLDMTASDVCNVIRRLERRGIVERRTVGQRKERGWHGSVVRLTKTPSGSKGKSA